MRVLVAEPPEPVLPPSPEREGSDPLERLTYRPTSTSGLFRVALQAGLLGVIANVIPFGMLLTGILAALLYHRAAGQTLTTGKAVRLGAMAGAVASSAFLFVVLAATFFFHAEQQLHDFLIKALNQAAAMSSPDVQSTIQSLQAPEGFATLVVAFVISALLTSIIFSAIGCIVGAVLFRERNRPTF